MIPDLINLFRFWFIQCGFLIEGFLFCFLFYQLHFNLIINILVIFLCHWSQIQKLWNLKYIMLFSLLLIFIYSGCNVIAFKADSRKNKNTWNFPNRAQLCQCTSICVIEQTNSFIKKVRPISKVLCSPEDWFWIFTNLHIYFCLLSAVFFWRTAVILQHKDFVLKYFSSPVLKPVVELLSDPDYINRMLLSQLEYREQMNEHQKKDYTYAPSYEEFIKLINSSSDVEFLKQLRYLMFHYSSFKTKHASFASPLLRLEWIVIFLFKFNFRFLFLLVKQRQ